MVEQTRRRNRLLVASLSVLLPTLSCGRTETSGLPGRIETLTTREEIQPCTPAATECRIFWVLEGAIGGADSPPGLDPVGASPAIDSRRRVFNAASVPGTLVIWNLDGEVVGVLGGAGEGPGEMEGLPVAQITLGDSIHVRDGAGSWSVFSPELEFVRKRAGVGLPFPQFTLATPRGQMIDAWGDPLFRVIGKDGSDLVQFGSPEASERLPRRLLAMGPVPDRFWAVPTHRMDLTEWGFDGIEHRNMTVPNTAFPSQPTDEPWNGAEGTPPPGVITHLATDVEGLIWVRSMLPDPDYTWSPPGSEEGQIMAFVDDTYDFLIEVIDPERGRVIASAWADETADGLSGILPGRWGFRMAQDSLGFLRLDFGRLELGIR